MDPARYPTENVQLERSDGYRGVPGVTTSVHYTTVAPGAPSDHVVWSICSFIHLNPCCLGLLALIFSIKLIFPAAPERIISLFRPETGRWLEMWKAPGATAPLPAASTSPPWSWCPS
ncbi:interferon-induced transmembrane protein 5-like isoform X2 [Pseudoliparis swirei]|uniref:interferon-induced transmembrane protein 5-like isoform X2 n=1 Tax=Pseudoliparis swirei TaxID=2059687 RepID=UPI0024BEAA79|nr:interferon-induced transmembrane protein 5-like isoform X2 [Pseudoliparis swirei]